MQKTMHPFLHRKADEAEQPGFHLTMHFPAVLQTDAEAGDPYELRHRSYFPEVNAPMKFTLQNVSQDHE